jgi:hypothetical protein
LVSSCKQNFFLVVYKEREFVHQFSNYSLLKRNPALLPALS